jgi:hypothetical protein
MTTDNNVEPTVSLEQMAAGMRSDPTIKTISLNNLKVTKTSEKGSRSGFKKYFDALLLQLSSGDEKVGILVPDSGAKDPLNAVRAAIRTTFGNDSDQRERFEGLAIKAKRNDATGAACGIFWQA